MSALLRAFRALVILNAIGLLGSSIWAENEFNNNQYLQAWLQENSLRWSFWWIPIAGGMAVATLILTFFRWRQVAGIFDTRQNDEAHDREPGASSQS